VVVDERGFVKRLNRHRGSPHDVGNPAANEVAAIRLSTEAACECVVGGEGNKWPRVLAALCQKVIGNGFSGCERIEPAGAGAVDFREAWSAAGAWYESLQFIRMEHPCGRAGQMHV